MSITASRRGAVCVDKSLTRRTVKKKRVLLNESSESSLAIDTFELQRSIEDINRADSQKMVVNSDNTRTHDRLHKSTNVRMENE